MYSSSSFLSFVEGLSSQEPGPLLPSIFFWNINTLTALFYCIRKSGLIWQLYRLSWDGYFGIKFTLVTLTRTIGRDLLGTSRFICRNSNSWRIALTFRGIVNLYVDLCLRRSEIRCSTLVTSCAFAHHIFMHTQKNFLSVKEQDL